MAKIALMGAGSTIFAKNLIGDCLLKPSLKDIHIALYDIDPQRLKDSVQMMENLNRSVNQGRATISGHLGVQARKEALKGADYIINAIQVGGYKPSTVIDFEIPKKYGLRQTIADTIGIGGIFRALRTIEVINAFARDIEAVCPNAWFLNYVNPMSMVTGWLQHKTSVKTVGLCHSVQICAEHLLKGLGMFEQVKNLRWSIAGINHMGWLLDIRDGDVDLYPQIKQRAAEINAQARKSSAAKHGDMIRYEMMRHFGYYITESSEHFAEYTPYWIKTRYPRLIEEFNIPLDEYLRRCEHQIQDWEKQRNDLVQNKNLTHTKTHEYGSDIIEAIEINKPIKFGGNIINHGLITNLPSDAVVEVPCLADGSGIVGCFVGSLPPQCAALNQMHINVHRLVWQAVATRQKDYVYQAAMLDPHTAAELSLDDIRAMCDDLFEAHTVEMLGVYR